MTRELFQPASRRVQLHSVATAIGMIGAAFVAGIALGVLSITGLALLGYGPETDPVLFSVVSSVAQYLGFFLAVIGYVVAADERSLIRIGWPGFADVAWTVGGFVSLVVAAYGVGAVITLLGLEPAENAAIVAGRSNPELFLWLIPIAIVFVGPAEELVFRGVVQGLIKRAYGAVPAILLTSVLFGVAHYVALVGQGTIVSLAVAGALGLVLGTVYEKSDNVVVPAVIHGIWNAMLFAANWYVVVYDVQLPT